MATIKKNHDKWKAKTDLKAYYHEQYLKRKESHNEFYRNYVKPKRYANKYFRGQVSKITDYYVKKLLVENGFEAGNITPELIEIKRQQIILKRLLHEKLQ